MSPTLLEIAVALALLWIAWRIGRLLAPWYLGRRRHRTTIVFPPDKSRRPGEKSVSPRDPEESKP